MTASAEPKLLKKGQRVWDWLQRSRPWRTYSHFTDTGGSVLAGGMSYQALFAVFAALYIGFSVGGIILRGNPELLETLVKQLNSFVPGLIGEDGAVPLQTLLDTPGFTLTSVVASLSLLWIAINWFTGTRRSIRIIFGLDVKEYRNPILLKLRDLSLAIAFSVAILLSAALTVMSSNLTEGLLGWLGVDKDNWLLGGIGMVVRYAALFAFDVLVLMAIHRYLAEVRVGWRKLLTGCVLGGIGFFALKMLGTLLLGGATKNPLLGAFVVFIGLLIWFNFICRVLLLTSSWIATGLDPKLGTEAELHTAE